MLSAGSTEKRRRIQNFACVPISGSRPDGKQTSIGAKTVRKFERLLFKCIFTREECSWFSKRFMYIILPLFTYETDRNELELL